MTSEEDGRDLARHLQLLLLLLLLKLPLNDHFQVNLGQLNKAVSPSSPHPPCILEENVWG